MVTAWDATPNEFPLNLDETVTGIIATPGSIDHWNFSAIAGQQVQFHLVNAAAGIAFRLTGPGGFVGFDNLEGDSPLITLAASGNYVLTAFGLGGRTGSYAFSLLADFADRSHVWAPPINGTLAGSGQAQLFRVDCSRRRVPARNAQRQHEHRQQRSLPQVRPAADPSDFDYRYSAVGSANQDVWSLNPQAGTWYVLVYAAGGAGAEQFTLTATTWNASVASYRQSESRQCDYPNTVITLTGAGFGASTTVSLVAASGTAYPAAAIQHISATTLSATFTAGTVPAGVYSLSVSKPGGTPYVLPNALTMVSGRHCLHLVAQASLCPDPIGWQYRLDHLRQYSNTGDAAMPAPLLVLTATLNGQTGDLADPGCF